MGTQAAAPTLTGDGADPEVQPRVDARPFWLEMTACPACRAPLTALDRCGRCDLEFSDDGGTPALLSPDLVRRYTLPYTGRTWEEARRVFEAAAGDPCRGRPSAHERSLPYHLDAAQAAVLGELPAGSAILEIGCGGAQCRPWFKERGHRYVGTDLCKTRVHDWLREFGGPDLLCDAHALPFRDASFDAVYAAALLEHVACPPLVMLEAARVLRRGGLFCGGVSFLEPWHDDSFFHCTPLGVVQLLVQAGLEPLHVWPGRGYTGFKAIPTMAFSPTFRLVARPLGALQHGLYSVQIAAGRLRRRLRGRPRRDTQRRAVAAGSIDWIARRP